MVVAFVFAAVEETDRLGSMALFFLIAVAIVGPYGVMRVRRVLAERAERQADAPTGDPPLTDPALVAPTADSSTGGAPIDELAQVIDAIDAGRNGENEFTVRIPSRPRLNGRLADPATVDALVQDAVRRSGVIVVGDHRSNEGRVLTCRRSPEHA